MGNPHKEFRQYDPSTNQPITNPEYYAAVRAGELRKNIVISKGEMSFIWIGDRTPMAYFSIPDSLAEQREIIDAGARALVYSHLLQRLWFVSDDEYFISTSPTGTEIVHVDSYFEPNQMYYVRHIAELDGGNK